MTVQNAIIQQHQPHYQILSIHFSFVTHSASSSCVLSSLSVSFCSDVDLSTRFSSSGVGCCPARFPLGVSRATRAAYRELLRGITEAPTFVIPRTGRSCQTRCVARTVMLSTAPLCDNGAVSKARAQCRTGRVDEFSPASGAARPIEKRRR